MIRPTAIIVSYNYADFLSLNLTHNKSYFDRIIVVTKDWDTETKTVCEKHGVECFVSNLFEKGGAKFNRGAVYNAVLRTLGTQGWVVLMDSDILMTPEFAALDLATLDSEAFYGLRRYDIGTEEKYLAVKERPERIADCLLFRGFGYGYFQMFNLASATFRQAFENTEGNPYPESYSNAESDWQFRSLWGEIVWEPDFNLNGHNEKNVKDYGTNLLRCLPFHCWHLGITGINSQERKTKKWVV